MSYQQYNYRYLYCHMSYIHTYLHIYIYIHIYICVYVSYQLSYINFSCSNCSTVLPWKFIMATRWPQALARRKSQNPMFGRVWEWPNVYPLVNVYINPALQPNSIPESSTYVFFQTLCQSPVFSVPRKLFRTYSQIQDLAILGYQW